MNRKQLYWDDVEVSGEVPSLPKTATSQMLVKWAAGSGDFNPLHYEFPFAQAQGLARPIIHGQLKRAWLVQLLTDWIGSEGFLQRFSCDFRAVDYPILMKSLSEPVEEKVTHWCKGIVTAKGVENEEYYVECEIWVENERGDKTTTGKARVILPAKPRA